MLKLFFSLLAVASISAFACTSWIISPEASETGTYIMHKTRDWGGGKEVDVRLFHHQREGGKYKALAFSPYMLFNEKGLGMIDTYVPPTRDGEHDKTFYIGTLMSMVVCNCATVQEALAMLEGFVKDGKRPVSEHYSLCDGKEAAVVEITPQHIAYRITKHGFSVHTNHHIYPEIAYLIKNTKINSGVASATRLHITQNILAEHLKEKGKISLVDTLALSRFADPEYKGMCPFRNGTVCASDFIAPAEQAGILGTLLICPGPTKYAPSIPIPLSISKIPAVLENGDFGKLVYQIKRNLPEDASVQPRLIALEQGFWKEYNETYAAAKKKFDAGDVDGFKAMLQGLVEKQTEQAYELVKTILTEKNIPLQNPNPEPKPAD